ncbi:tetratricopeptide repeat protein [Sphingobium bisphenolivorans]|uniref:tetratricopeptide repeat protein n=1 Tax=Sphingobium bisphenolivorans TaxID=1335760 RepID=UPI0003A1F1FE|nr:SPOR domain-containing protein [Sphingobium bisphenolivorans]
MKRSIFWILGSLLLAGTAQAQPGQVQAIRPSGAESLNRHLARLASNPRDIEALIGAGEAALTLDDTRAAAGFFARADTLQPNNARVKAGLGRVMLNNQNPAEALRMFDQAVRAGLPETTILGDRAIARDMTGDQAGAQRDYQAALQRTPDDPELIQRYAASLGISGQVDAAERVLKPLLYKSDRAAWRYRAFILAMNNRQAEAKKIAEQTLPQQLASALLPYMQKMPYLTPAQKAAAVNFGHFPARVGTQIAAVTPTPAPSVPPLAAQQPNRPVAAPRATVADQPVRQSRNGRSERASPAVPTPSTRSPIQWTQTQPVPRQPAPTQAVTARQSASPSTQPPAQPLASTTSRGVQGPPAPAFETVPAPSMTTSPAPSQLNAITLAQASAPRQDQPMPASAAPSVPAAPTPAAAAPAPAPATAPAAPAPAQQAINPEVTRSLADIIHAIDVPDTERQPNVAAVDLAEVAALQARRRAEREATAAAAADKAKKAAAAKAKAEADAKAKQLAEEKKKAAEEKARLAANPARNWLQVGTGANKGALAFTMKGLRKKYDSLEPQDAWVAGWGRTNRLLVGPFASFTRAKTLEDKLKAAGADVFAWKSDAGEVVERLPAN